MLTLCLFAPRNAVFSQNGGHFEWVRTYTAPDLLNSTTNKIIGSCVDSAGNLYILGEFSPQAALCGVDLVPHSILVPPLRRAVVIAKLSPHGDLLWHKALHSNLGCYAHGLRQLGDSAIMVQTGIRLPYDHGYGEYNNLYYLDTLLTGNDDYLVPIDSIGSTVNAFITFGYDGEVLEQHFLSVGLLDTNGLAFTPHYLGINSLDLMYTHMFSNKTFNVDNNGNIYVIRQAVDYIGNPLNDQIWSIADGTVGALKIVVDGIHFIEYHPDRRSALWNYQIMKFAPHFDSLISAVYVFDSTDQLSVDPQVELYDFNVDSFGNMYVNMYGTGLPSTLNVSNSLSPLIVDGQILAASWMIKYNSYCQAIDLVQISHIGDTFDAVMAIYSHLDETTNSILLSGGVHLAQNSSVDAIICKADTLDISNEGAFWIRMDKDNLRVLSYGQIKAGENGLVHEPMLTTQHNRVFAQTKLYDSVSFADTTVYIPTSADDNAFFVWDYDGHELFVENYNSYSTKNEVAKPVVKDSIVYLPGTLFAPATFGSHTTQTMGYSYAYIAQYVDTAFMTPYVHVDSMLSQSIEWEQNLSFQLADSPVELTAVSTSGLPVTYTCSDTTVARVEGSTLQLLAEGTATVTASQGGNHYYLPATPVTKTLQVTPATGIAIADGKLSVHPNPAKEALWFSLGGERVRAIRAVSSVGVCTNVPFTGAKADLSALPSGVYYLSFVTDSNIYQHKIIKL